MSLRILVVGASGFIATWLIRDLLKAGHNVVGIDSKPLDDECKEFIGCDFEFHQIDVFQYLFEQTPEVDVIVPLTGELGSVESVEKPFASLRNGVIANLTLLNTIKDVPNPPLIVFVSSDLCYRQDSRCIYSLHKKVVEDYLRIYHRVYGIPYVILRTATCYGPLQKRKSVVNLYVERALAGKTIPVYGDGENRQAFIYIDDAVRCMRMACVGDVVQNRIVPLVGENLRIVDLAYAVAEVLGGEVEHKEWPDLAKKVNVGDLPILSLPPRGWYSKVKIHEGVKLTADWMRERVELDIAIAEVKGMK